MRYYFIIFLRPPDGCEQSLFPWSLDLRVGWWIVAFSSFVPELAPQSPLRDSLLVLVLRGIPSGATLVVRLVRPGAEADGERVPSPAIQGGLKLLVVASILVHSLPVPPRPRLPLPDDPRSSFVVDPVLLVVRLVHFGVEADSEGIIPSSVLDSKALLVVVSIILFSPRPCLCLLVPASSSQAVRTRRSSSTRSSSTTC